MMRASYFSNFIIPVPSCWELHREASWPKRALLSFYSAQSLCILIGHLHFRLFGFLLWDSVRFVCVFSFFFLFPPLSFWLAWCWVALFSFCSWRFRCPKNDPVGCPIAAPGNCNISLGLHFRSLLAFFFPAITHPLIRSIWLLSFSCSSLYFTCVWKPIFDVWLMRSWRREQKLDADRVIGLILHLCYRDKIQDAFNSSYRILELCNSVGIDGSTGL